MAFLVAALVSPSAGIAYADVEDAVDAAPAAVLLEEATEDGSGGDPSDDATVAYVVPRARVVVENGPLAECEFLLCLNDANNEVLDEATNDSGGDVHFSRLSFTAHDLDTDSETGKPVATTFTYHISELPQDERRYAYDASIIQMSVVVTPGEDGTVHADVAYGRLDGNGSLQPTDDPTFTNRFNTVALNKVCRSREEPHDPLPGVHYGLWMVNFDGEDFLPGPWAQPTRSGGINAGVR